MWKNVFFVFLSVFQGFTTSQIQATSSIWYTKSMKQIVYLLLTCLKFFTRPPARMNMLIFRSIKIHLVKKVKTCTQRVHIWYSSSKESPLHLEFKNQHQKSIKKPEVKLEVILWFFAFFTFVFEITPIKQPKCPQNLVKMTQNNKQYP